MFMGINVFLNIDAAININGTYFQFDTRNICKMIRIQSILFTTIAAPFASKRDAKEPLIFRMTNYYCGKKSMGQQWGNPLGTVHCK